jgi:hypothetical protein
MIIKKEISINMIHMSDKEFMFTFHFQAKQFLFYFILPVSHFSSYDASAFTYVTCTQVNWFSIKNSQALLTDHSL